MKVNMQKSPCFSAAKSWVFLAVVLQLLLSIAKVNSLPATVESSRSHPNPSEEPEDDSNNKSPFHIAADNPISSSSSFHLDSSSSSLHKIIHHHHHQPYVQPTRTGAFHLHKLIQKLSFHKESPLKNKKPTPPTRPRQNTKNGIASTINVKSLNGSLLTTPNNNDTASRLKRQLEGIFHVRDTPSTSTIIPILPSASSDQSNSNTASTRKSLFTRPDNRRLRVGLTNVTNKSHHQRVNSTKTTKVETRKEKKFPKESFELDSTSPTAETPHSLVTAHKWNKPPLGSSTTTTTSPYKKNGGGNVTVEIIETSRRTVIKHDGINNHRDDNGESPVEMIPFGDSRSIPTDQVAVLPSRSPIQEESSLLKSTPIFRSIRPRLRHQKRFRQGGQVGNKNTNESHPPSSPEDSTTTIEDSQPSTTTTRPRRNNNNSNNNKSTKSLNLPKREIIIEDLTQPEDVKVSSFQEQIPYNDREVSEADLKDYLEGHTTFGAKGNFKHTINRNITGFIPHHQSSSEVKRSHGVYKRTPQPNLDPPGFHSQRKRNSARGGNNHDRHNAHDPVSISQAEVKKFRGRNENPKMTIYTASGVKYAPSEVDEEEDLRKQFYEYSGSKSSSKNKDKSTRKESGKQEGGRNQDGRDVSSEDNSNQFDELYKQGHPGIAKPPQIIYKSHPLGVPYGRVEELDLYESPLRADPLSDDVPLKFDPASDVFYGNPKPDKDKTIAQSNRPAPVRVENEDRESTTTSNNRHPYRDDEFSKRVGESEGGGPDENGRYYPPPSYSEDESQSSRRPPSYEPSSTGDDQYFKDFVSLDNNFQQLPRPSKEDESFSSLIPPEANDYEDDGRYYGDEDDDDYNRRGEGSRGRGSSTSGYERDDRRTTDRNSDRDRYNKDSDRQEQDEHDNNNNHEDETTERSRGDDERRGSSSSRRPPSRSGGQYGDDGYDDFGLNQEGVSPEYFDSSYVDALKHFDDEIKKLEEHERQVGSTENPTNNPGATTRDPPLVISSPGPAVSYERTNHPRPSPGSTEPTHYNEHPRSEEDEESHRQDEEVSKPPEKGEPNGDNNEEEPEEEEEGEEVEEEVPREASSTKKDETDQGGGEEDSEEDDSQPEKRGVKVVETEEVKRVRQEDTTPSNSTTNSSAKDSAGNIDDDISGIEKEYGGK